MKSLTGSIIWAVATFGSIVAAIFAGYQAVHSTGRIQSGYDMCLFAALAIILALLDLNDHKGNSWLPKVVAILCILIAIVFGIHYFEGDAAIKALLGRNGM